MTVAIHVPVDKGTIWEPVELAARIRDVPYELAGPVLERQPRTLIVHDDGSREWVQALRGVKVNDLSPIWPLSHFRSLVMASAKAFVKAMAEQDEKFELRDHEGDIRIFGPYQSKGKAWLTDGELAFGWARGELFTPGFADFQLRANFVAKYGHTIEIPSRN